MPWARLAGSRWASRKARGVSDRVTAASLRKIYAGLSSYGLSLVIEEYGRGLRDLDSTPQRRQDYGWRLSLAQAEKASRKE